MGRLPHVFLVGEGAARFAREIGAEAGENLTADSAAAWRAGSRRKSGRIHDIGPTRR